MTKSTPTIEEWVTWPQAAAVAGVPVPTIDWHTRDGRIRTRPHHGNRPSVNRASVEEFATWYAERQADLASRRVKPLKRDERVRPASVRRAEWVDHDAAATMLGMSRGALKGLCRAGVITAEVEAGQVWLNRAEVEHEAERRKRSVSASTAAEVLGVVPETVRNMWRAGDLDGVVEEGRLRVDRQSLARVLANRQQWVSQVEAAQLVGCTISDIAVAARRGEIEKRSTYRSHPSLRRSSVLDFAVRWEAGYAERASNAEKNQADRAAAAQAARERHLRRHGPQDGHVWLSTQETAALLDLSRSGVKWAASRDRLPHIKAGGRVWFRRDHIERIARARQVKRSRRDVSNV